MGKFGDDYAAQLGTVNMELRVRTYFCQTQAINVGMSIFNSAVQLRASLGATCTTPDIG